MRHALILLAPLLLSACIKTSGSYYIDGREQTLSVRAEQDYFWSKQVTLKLVTARLPDCQRQVVLGQVPVAGLQVELFASTENAYTLRAGDQVWQVETQGCTQLEAPSQAALGQPLGVFRLDPQEKLVFEKAGTTATQ